MTRDIIDIQDFTILVEEAFSDKEVVDACSFDEPVIAVALYGSGDVDLDMRYGNKNKEYNHTKGLALSFYADEHVVCEHTVSAGKPLQCLVIATALRNLDKLPNAEGELFSQMLHQLVNPQDHYVEGPRFFMSPEMQDLVDAVFANNYEGKMKMMFFRSQVTLLLAHFLGQLSTMTGPTMKDSEREKLLAAKAILDQNLETPPSLTDLARQIGVNTFKLKKNFKALFGVPVFKYLQETRLSTAYELLKNQDATVQEAAWQVGYDSLSSFSNAFAQKFGYRPSQVRTISS